MKICHLTSRHPVDDGRIFERYSRVLYRLGHEVVLIARHDRDEIKQGVQIFGVKKRGALWWRLLTPLECWFKAIRSNADCYHFHDPDLIPLALCAKILGKRIVYDVHEDYQVRFHYAFPTVLGKLLGNIYRCIENTVAKHFDGIVAVSNSMLIMFPSYDENGAVVQSVPDVHRIDDIIVKHQNYSTFTGIVSGVQSIERGIARVVQALPYVLKEHLELSVLFAGRWSPQEYKNEILHEARLLGVEKHIRTEGALPWADNLNRIASSDIGFVLLADDINNKKALPNRLFEYMLCGIPVVAEDMPEVSQIVRSTKCGLVISSRSPQSIAEAIIELMGNEELRKEMGNNGRTAILEKYNFETQVKQLERLYGCSVDGESNTINRFKEV